MVCRVQCRDFAIEKGHQKCAQFLRNPQKEYHTAKKHNKETKVLLYLAKNDVIIHSVAVYF